MNSFLYYQKGMFLSTVSNHTSNYHSTEIVDEEKHNIDICTGLFSGSGSNYSMYKSNCFDLMVNKCSVQIDDQCKKYMNQLNQKEYEMFTNTITKNKIPMSYDNCKIVSHPYLPNEIMVMGMNSYQSVDNTYFPTSCNKSIFLQKSQDEYEASLHDTVKNNNSRLMLEQRLVQEKRVIQSESPLQSDVTPILSNPALQSMTPIPFNHMVQKIATTSNSDSEFYKKMTTVDKECERTCKL